MSQTKRRTVAPHIRQRLERCRKSMRENGVRAFLVSKPADLFYLTGFTGEDSAALVLPDRVHLLSDRRFEEVARQECPWARAWMRKGSLNQEIGKAAGELRIKSMAVQPDGLTLAGYDDARKQCRGCKLTKAPDIVGGMRRYKDAEELRCMRVAIRVAQEAFLALRRAIRVGMTETDLASRLEFEMKRRGAERPSFPTIIAEGANSALPHAHPGRRKVHEGSAILVDWGARVGEYCSDLTRMVFIGTVSPRFQRMYEAVLAAQEEGLQAVRPGARMCDVDAVARRRMKKAGLGREFSHGLGHGLGIDIHEPPSVSWRSDELMQPGMTVTIEPGAYVPGVGGVRIEDDVLVSQRGATLMTSLPKSLESAVVRG